jgi:hypothetical protein
LTAGQRAGEFREFDPVVIAMTITQGIDGALTYWAEHPGADLTAYGEELVTLFQLATQRTGTQDTGTRRTGRKG